MSKKRLAFLYYGTFPSDHTALNSRMLALTPSLGEEFDLTLVSLSHKRATENTSFNQLFILKEKLKIPKVLKYWFMVYKTTLWTLKNRNGYTYFYYYHPYLQTSLISLMLAHILGKKTITEMTEVESTRTTSNIASKLYWVKSKLEESCTNRFSDILFVISSQIKDHYQKTLSRKKKIEVLPVVIEPGYETLFSTSRSNNTTLLYMGTFSEKDDVQFIIRAFNLAVETIPQLKLKLIGNGPQHLRCVQLVNELNLEPQVIFKGAISSSEIPTELIDVDTLIMNRDNSAFSNMGFPTKLANYMVTGIPIICSKTASLSTLPEDTVLFYEPNNHKDFVSKILFRYSKDDFDVQAKNALQYANQQFSPEMVGNILTSNISEL